MSVILHPRSAYVHIPFCRHRCGYCNFTLVAGRDDLIDHFLLAIEREMERTLGAPIQVDTLFLGGGTPTHLGPRSLQRLLEVVARWIQLRPGYEYSCEANPLDCSDDVLQTLSDWGVNRLSLGGQSFSDRKLLTLERDHNGQQLAESLQRCSRYFENLSLDLIFAVPGESLRLAG